MHTRVYRANNVACAMARFRVGYRLLRFRLAHHVTRRFCCVAEWLYDKIREDVHQNATIWCIRVCVARIMLRARWRGFEWYRLLRFRLAHHVTRRFCCVAEWLSRRKSVGKSSKRDDLGALWVRNCKGTLLNKRRTLVCITLLLIPKVAKAKV